MFTVPGISGLAKYWWKLNCGLALIWDNVFKVVGIKGIFVDLIVESFVFNVDANNIVDSVDCWDPTVRFVVAAIVEPSVDTVVDWVDTVKYVVPSEDIVVFEGTVGFIDVVDFVMGVGALGSVYTATLRR